MTPEEIAAATAKAEAEKAEKEKVDAEAAEVVAKAKAEEDANANKEHQIDYKAELAKERAAKEKAEKELAERDFKVREAARKAKETEADEGTIDEDKPLTARDLKEFETRIAQRTQKELQATRITELARELAQNDDEANLLVEIHKNRIFPEHLSLDEQMQEAYAIANGRQLAAKNQELARALKSKETSSRMSGSAHQDSPMLDAPKLSSAEATALKDAGMTWDATKRAFKKPLSGGKKNYYFDPKTKKRWTE